MTPLVRLLSLPIQAYRLVLSPWIGHNCRYQPTCSCYALEALETHGAARGGYLAVRRLARCNPFGGSGYDPVPPGITNPGITKSATTTSSVQQGSV
ncbi:MAG: membrane protein insertion efficiency factor YidD [Ferrovibrio sp.]|uniref:membrane protein insertion efficiency factor YidD n=1 Tax=Ferrovibrio sp. TaxID=1917215 RepID=UPI0026138C84|nr:membrane protein insertion efficiency factor YidD [Ferrovibrio sp.]MCW0232328.1 membrane protein insertion efficiency factor YidD [Ferrovibrio sp.]